ncbi:AAA family ATPase [Desulfovibrio mangrovi]|uniref:Lon protease family protein n=1 Tax=Desulfovibrio mangrovi TaxID=2976983 RepID=UPI0022471694|nr:ATP-binding protein [Desulfovibrio mangrovi]UZP65918.1 AAA family ATPase [Desulfovibrio mangrovi]
MSKVRPLPASKLRTQFDPKRISCDDSHGISRKPVRRSPQPRAMEALELALSIHNNGYNVYLAGGPSLGRNYMLQEFLRPRAEKLPTPSDLIYVNNFEDADAPKLIELPAGQGRKLKTELAQAISKVRKELPARFENDAYIKKRNIIMDRFQDERDKLFQEMDKVAVSEGFNMDLDETGSMTLYPLIEGKRLSEEEFERLDAELRQSLKTKGDKLLQVMTSLMRKMSTAEQALRTDERSLDQDLARETLQEMLTPVTDKFLKACESEELEAFFTAIQNDILESVDQFVQRDPAPSGAPAGTPESILAALPQEDITARYEINLFVDHSETKGAPIVVDDHPTVSNLLGCIERIAEMGALITDYTLIKSGSIHQANGGFLVMHIEDLLSQSGAWEGLMRALRSGIARIEDAGDTQESTKTKGIEPEPMMLDIKVILIGPEDIYEHLLQSDDRFPKLFKIKAHMSEAMPRNADGVRVYLHRLAGIIDDCDLLPFSKDALASIIDYSSRLIEDQKKLSLRFPHIRELMVESDAFARMKKRTAVDAETVHDALVARYYRNNLYEELYMEDYDRELIKVQTSGMAVGRVNGLAVSFYGDFEFGLPHQISCTVGVGHGGIIDLEREAELGGPIHTKAMMILKSYLLGMFAQNKPIVMTGSLYFEQSYAGIEGDSASGAELATLLSALSGVPLSQSLAFTGAVSQTGQIMAVGGVTRKIEGFFDVCQRRGLTGEQGVLLPYDNVDQLMLKKEVIEAVDEGKFAIYPIRHITEAMELLTGMSAGNRRKDGTFTKGSIFDKVDRRLIELGKLAERAYKSKR